MNLVVLFYCLYALFALMVLVAIEYVFCSKVFPKDKRKTLADTLLMCLLALLIAWFYIPVAVFVGVSIGLFVPMLAI